jgi:hypothetical protein
MKRRRTQPENAGVSRVLNSPRGAQLLAALLRRVGETPEQRLRWIVDDFLRCDLSLLRPGEFAAKGDDLRAAAVYSLPSGRGLTTTTSPMAPGVLRRFQHDISTGLSDLLGKDGRWALSGRPTLQRREGGFRIEIDGDGEKAGILGGIAALVVAAGDRLRTCKDRKCGLPFVAIKRQEYCKLQHSQRERNRIRLDRERAEMEKEKGDRNG